MLRWLQESDTDRESNPESYVTTEYAIWRLFKSEVHSDTNDPVKNYIQNRYKWAAAAATSYEHQPTLY